MNGWAKKLNTSHTPCRQCPALLLFDKPMLIFRSKINANACNAHLNQLAAIEMHDYLLNLSESILDSFDAAGRVIIEF